MADMYVPQDMFGFGRLANIEMEKRREDRLDKESDLRNKVTELQLAQTVSNIETAKRKEKLRDEISVLVKQPPEGENSFTAAYKHMMANGAFEEADAWMKRQSDIVDNLMKQDRSAGTKLLNESILKATGMPPVTPHPNYKDIFEGTDPKTGKPAWLQVTDKGIEAVPNPGEYTPRPKESKINPYQKTTSYVVNIKGKPYMAVGVMDPKSGKIKTEYSPIEGELLSKEGESAWGRTEREISEAGSKTRVTESEKMNAEIITQGHSAAESLKNTKTAINLLNSVKTGGINKVLNDASRIFGVQAADEAELSYMMSKAVLSQLRSTFGAQFTEREGARLEKIEASFGKSPEANKRLLQDVYDMSMAKARRALNRAIKSGDTVTADEIRELIESNKMVSFGAKGNATKPTKQPGGMTDEKAKNILLGK